MNRTWSITYMCQGKLKEVMEDQSERIDAKINQLMEGSWDLDSLRSLHD